MAARQRCLSTKELEALPSDVLSAMLREVQTELQTGRRAAAAERREYEQLQLRVRNLEKELAVSTAAEAQRRQRDARAADAAERTARLIRAARRRGQEYEAAIAQTLEEIEQLRNANSNSNSISGGGGCGTTSPTSLSLIAPEKEEVPSINSSSLQPDVDVASASVSPSHIGSTSLRSDVLESPPHEATRVAAAVRAASAEQQRSVLQHALAHRVARVERENAMLRKCLVVLQRGDASSAKLYHELEHAPSSTSV